MFDYKIVLASASPRRKELLKILDLNFRIINPDIEEKYPPSLDIRFVAEYLAALKARAVLPEMQNEEIVLAADTIVLIENKIFGKPKDEKDAKKMLHQLSGKMHEVMTGVCLQSANKKKIFTEISRVWFRTMDKKQIDFYVEKYKPLDKAGSYAIQEWIGVACIEKIEGCFYNIMGLPTSRLLLELKSFAA
jgi:septum formation protein